MEWPPIETYIILFLAEKLYTRKKNRTIHSESIRAFIVKRADLLYGAAPHARHVTRCDNNRWEEEEKEVVVGVVTWSGGSLMPLHDAREGQ